MPRFFVCAEQIETTDANTRVTIVGEDAHHISRSLRMAAGEEITVCPLDGAQAGRIEYRCVLDRFGSDSVGAAVLDCVPCQAEPPYTAILYVALSKADKLESVIQKAVECGASEIVPFVSSRCVVRPGDGEAKKLLRRKRIAAEAAKQCGRGLIPSVREPISFSEMLTRAAAADIPLFFYEGESAMTLPDALAVCSEKKAGCSISLVIGAEGGFSAEEVEKAKAAGLLSVGLGKRILRCETAPVFALSCLSYALELSVNNLN